jgi:hypothetical protein
MVGFGDQFPAYLDNELTVPSMVGCKKEISSLHPVWWVVSVKNVSTLPSMVGFTNWQALQMSTISQCGGVWRTYEPKLQQNMNHSLLHK